MSTEVFSSMPGKIIEINVKEGDEVIEGQELLVVEAMKMENPIAAPVDGKVKAIKTVLDEQVESKQTLLVLE